MLDSGRYLIRITSCSRNVLIPSPVPVENRLNIFGGLVYFQRHQTIGYVEKTVGNTEILQGPNGEIMLQPEFNYEHRTFEYEVRNLGLQIGVNYQLAKRKFLQTLGTGIEFHLALNKLADAPELTNNPSAYVFYNFYYRYNTRQTQN